MINNCFNGTWLDVAYGSEASLLMYALEYDLVYLLTGGSFIALGLIPLFMFFSYQTSRLLLYYSIISIASGVAFLAYRPSWQLFVSDEFYYTLGALVKTFPYFIILVVLMFFYIEIFGSGRKKWVLRLAQILLVLGSVYFLSAVSGFSELEYVMFIFVGSLSFFIPFVLLIGAWSYRKQTVFILYFSALFVLRYTDIIQNVVINSVLDGLSDFNIIIYRLLTFDWLALMFYMGFISFGYIVMLYFENTRKELSNKTMLAQQLHKISITDGLTNIYNRRYFDACMQDYWSKYKNSMALLFIDVDYFKKYNDHYGHQAGDECLVKIATVLHSVAEQNDGICARYGGEEFALVFKSALPEQVEKIAQTILDRTEDLNIEHRYSENSDYVTLSIGVMSMITTPVNSIELIVQNADFALYEAKYSGRNRYCVFDDLSCNDQILAAYKSSL